MTQTRRRFLQLATSATLIPAAPYVARAQGGYPNHPVRIIVGQAAGSSSDIAARLMAQWLTEKLNGQFIVEVKPLVSTLYLHDWKVPAGICSSSIAMKLVFTVLFELNGEKATPFWVPEMAAV